LNWCPVSRRRRCEAFSLGRTPSSGKWIAFEKWIACECPAIRCRLLGLD
jgi:hypothetical protein